RPISPTSWSSCERLWATARAGATLLSAKVRDDSSRDAMSRSLRAAGAVVGALLIAAPRIIAALEVGLVAPDFGMTTIEGRHFSLTEAEKTHSGVVILFLSTICPYSNYYNDLIRDMAGEFAKRNVLFVGVNSGGLETAEEMRVHAREHGHA